jgi:isoleucyl-tRNA synthetase
LLADFPEVDQSLLNPNLDEFWSQLIITRDTVNKALEQARGARKIGSSLEAQVLIKVEDSSLSDKIISLGENLPGFFITSQAQVENGKSTINSTTPTKLDSLEPLSELSENGMNIFVLKAEGQKCGRCWKYTTTTGHDKNFVELCKPCAEVEAAK